MVSIQNDNTIRNKPVVYPANAPTNKNLVQSATKKKNAEKTNSPQSKEEQGSSFSLVPIAFLIVITLLLFNKNHRTIKPFFDKIASWFGQKTVPATEEHSTLAEELERWVADANDFLDKKEGHLIAIAAELPSLQGDFKLWTKIKAFVEKEKGLKTVEEKLEEEAKQGYVPFIEELVHFYLERAGIVIETDNQATLPNNEAEKIQFYKPAYHWLKVLESVGTLTPKITLQQAQLRIKMRRTATDWQTEEAQLKQEAQRLIDTVNTNIKNRLNDRLEP